MSIATELTLLANSKQAIKASINAKGGSVTDSTPFADYSTAIDNLPSGGSSDLILKSDSEVSDYSGTTISNWNSFYKAVGFEVKLPPTVTSYGRLFTSTGFTKIIFPSSYSFTTNQGLFYNCQNLKEIDLSNSGLTDLNFYKAYSSDTSKGFFEGCSSLTSVTLPSTLTSIGDNAFFKCSALTSIDIPSGVTSIGTYAFLDCSSLTTINLPNSLTTIGNAAFSGTDITSLTIPSSVSTISTEVGFSLLFRSNNANADFHITVDANNVTYDSRGNCNAIIETSTNKLIQGCNNTVIPNTVTALDQEAFTYVNFYGKTFFEVPDSVTNYANSFRYVSNSNLHFKIGKGISAMPNILFSSTIDTLEVPETITTWNGFSVLNGGHVKKYILHNPTPVTITQNPTYFVRPSEAIYVPAESVEAYKADSFWSNYASIIQAIPEDVKPAFKFTSSVDSSKDITVNCEDTETAGTLKANDLGMSSQQIDEFRLAENTGSVEIGDCVKIYMAAVCYTAKGISEVKLNEGLERIGDFAFGGMSALTEITIPSTVTNISYQAFYADRALTSVTCLATTPPTLGSDVFGDTNNCPIFVQSESVDTYKTAWSQYADRIQAIPAE